MSAVISSPVQWKLASLPRALKPDEVQRLLGAFPSGRWPRRGYAIVRCALDMGLRAGEIANLLIDDIDWREGTVTLKGTKSRRQDILPLPMVAAHRDVSSLQVIEHALGVPAKRFERPMLGYLSREEMLAVIGTPDGTWFSQRDHVLLLLLYNTGARVSEITGVKVGEVVLEEGAACVHLHGKGRKQRSVPLWRSTVRAIRAWLRRNPQFDSDSPLLPNRDGQAMSRWNVIQRLDHAVQLAAESCPDLATRHISPHVIRHTTAMHLLQAGVDISVIALWLGHESPATTHLYVEADLAMKERALARLQEPETKLRRYRAPDSLIDFLRTL